MDYREPDIDFASPVVEGKHRIPACRKRQLKSVGVTKGFIWPKNFALKPKLWIYLETNSWTSEPMLAGKTAGI